MADDKSGKRTLAQALDNLADLGAFWHLLSCMDPVAFTDAVAGEIKRLRAELHWIASHPIATDPPVLAAMQMRERAVAALKEADSGQAG